MTDLHDLGFLWAGTLLVLGTVYVVAYVVATAWFRAKLRYHQEFFRLLRAGKPEGEQ